MSALATTTAPARAADVSDQSRVEHKHVDPFDVLELRAWARAFLWHAGEYELAAAIDPLVEFAAGTGLDVDRAQQILANAFAPYRGAP